MKKITILIILIILKSMVPTIAQNSKLDSLFTVLKTAKADTTRINIYNALCREYQSLNPDTALYFANVALNLAIKANYKKGMAISYNIIGLILYYKGDYDKAIEFYFKRLKISEESGDKNGMTISYNSIGVIHADKGDYDKAIEFYFKSLKISEELLKKSGNSDSKAYREVQKGISASYNNIGNIYARKGNYDKAIEFFFKSLKVREELGDKMGMATSYNNIGLIHDNKRDYDKAIEFYFKSLKICEELGRIHPELVEWKKGMSTSYNNIGIIYANKGDYNKTIEFFLKSLKINEESGDKNDMAGSYTNIGSLYLMQGKPKEAKKQQLLALNITKEIGAKDLMYYVYSSLAQCDSALGNFSGAYEYHKLYSQLHDSVFSKKSNDKIAEMGAKYEAEKRELTIQKLEKEKLLQNETLARKEAESKKQRILLFSFLTGFIIILVFSIFLYRLFVQKKMANIILAQQKEEISAQRDEIETQRDLVTQQKEHIEHIHEEQTDSIRYAERIQRAVLPNLAEILSLKLQISNTKTQEGLELGTWSLEFESFILFKPKDIVSGDFYYIAQRKNILLFAVADCTGHGVPGAFMSMLGISFLNEIIAKEEIQIASHVLNELRQYVINSLQQKGMVGEQQDGMDIAFIALNTETSTLEFAGANNPLYIISVESNEVVTIKADSMPVGIYGDMHPFKNNTIKVNKGDRLYIFSDGFIDQFGGENHKKFLSKRFKESLLQIAHLPMQEQKENLNNIFENWKGNGDQIDDVTVFGLKI